MSATRNVAHTNTILTLFILVHVNRGRVDDRFGGRFPERGGGRSTARGPPTPATLRHIGLEPIRVDWRDGVHQVSVQLELPEAAARITSMIRLCKSKQKWIKMVAHVNRVTSLIAPEWARKFEKCRNYALIGRPPTLMKVGARL